LFVGLLCSIFEELKCKSLKKYLGFAFSQKAARVQKCQQLSDGIIFSDEELLLLHETLFHSGIIHEQN
jgi:hypothetical protein